MKNKTSFTMVLFFAVIAVMGAVGILNRGQKDEQKEAGSPTVYDEIMATDLETGYPMDPALVVDINNKITAFLYGGSITEEQIGPVIQKQRMLYTKTLADMNEEEAQIVNANAHVELLKKNNQRLLEVKAFPVEFDPENDEMCSVLVVQYTNTKVNNELMYYLQKEDDRWKIASFGFAGDEMKELAEDTPADEVE